MAQGSNALSSVLSRALIYESGLTVTDWPHIPVDKQPDFITAVARHRVSSTIAPVGQFIGLTPESQNKLDYVLSQDILGSMRLQSAAAAITDVLTQAGVRSIVYKGVALAAQTTGDPATRGFGDVDILVSPSDFIAAHDALIDAGARSALKTLPDPHSHLWPTAQRIGCEVPYRWRDVDLDMHWRFDRLPQIANISFDRLWDQRTYVTLAGQQVATLGELDALMVTSVHGTKEHWRQWRWVVDAVRQMRVVPEEDWKGIRRYARETGCEVGLAVAVAVANRLVPGSSPFNAGTRATRLADLAWIQAANDNAPFGDYSLKRTKQQLSWMFQTLPSASSAASVVVRMGWAHDDLAEVPLPRYLLWAYPLLRPFLWFRRHRSESDDGRSKTKSKKLGKG
jgi:hypothetical protein